MTTTEEIISKHSEKIDTIDNDIIMEVVGVAQAVDALRKALDKVETCLTERNFEKASSLGYGDVASEFIFLQRTLGGLQDSALERQRFISDLAVELGNGNYEETESLVKPYMKSLQPRKELTKEELENNKIAHEKAMKELRSKYSVVDNKKPSNNL